jgi:hypothetical protein
MRQTILDWVHDFNRTAETPIDPMRFIFRNWMEDKIQYLALIDAIVREGEGGCGIDSLGAVSVHTGANDCMIRGCPLFTWRNPSGAMPSRVAAEVVTAAGLEKVCVADTRQGVVTLVVNYWRDKVLRERLKAFMARTQESRIGFFDEQRIPDALHRTVEHYFSEFMRIRGDWTQLKDQHFPYDGPVEIFATDPRADTRKKLLEEMNVEDGIQAVRLALPKTYFRESTTNRIVEALRQYQRDWDEKQKAWRSRPRHDWASHGADAFRYLMVGRQDAGFGSGAPLKRGLKGV